MMMTDMAQHQVKKSEERHLYSASMKLADLIDANPRILGVISRVGIGFGFGDATVKEACEKSGVNVNTFILICNVYTYDGYSPSLELMHKADIKDIVRYLHSSHAYYMDVALRNLATFIENMIAPCDEKLKKIIWKFFSDYKDEIAKHFQYEEGQVFPYVDAVLNHKDHEEYTIGQYQETHSNIEEKLNDLKNIVMKYLPKVCQDNMISMVLSHLYALEEDLEKHTSIEDGILVPLVNRLEEENETRQ